MLTFIYMLVFILLLSALALVIVTTNLPSYMRNIYAGKPVDCRVREVKPNARYMQDGVTMNLSKYSLGRIRGFSLDKEGIKDGSIVFYNRFVWFDRMFRKDALGLKVKQGSFLIFKNDSKRVRKEYPDRSIISGWKIRKVVGYIQSDIPYADLEKIVRDNCREGEYNEELMSRISNKFIFAKEYYKKDDKLIMSLTYHNEEQKDFSFHSLSFLRGEVKYVSTDNKEAA